jgi:TRAP-type mannitol/chloroaromatic compound transport system substrate-binding protein
MDASALSNLRLAPSETSVYFQLFAVTFADNVERLTGGRVQITAYPAGVLAPAFEVYEAVQDGRADVGNTWPGYLVRQDPANSLISAHPGGMGTDAYLTWLYEGGGQELWQEFRRETMGLHALVTGAGPSEIHMHSRQPVRTTADLEGLRVRMSGAAADILEGFGGAPVTVPGGEIYTMLERGAVDAAEWSTPAENMVLGLHEIAPYAIMPGIHQPVFAFDFVMRAEEWDALPDEIKTQIEAAAKLTTFEAFHRWVVQDLEALEKLRASDIEFITVDDEYLEAWRQAGRDWAERHAEDNEWVRRIADSYYEFLDRWEENIEMHLNQQR